jgi:hypothetical protein
MHLSFPDLGSHLSFGWAKIGIKFHKNRSGMVCHALLIGNFNSQHSGLCSRIRIRVVFNNLETGRR